MSHDPFNQSSRSVQFNHHDPFNSIITIHSISHINLRIVFPSKSACFLHCFVACSILSTTFQYFNFASGLFEAFSHLRTMFDQCERISSDSLLSNSSSGKTLLYLLNSSEMEISSSYIHHTSSYISSYIIDVIKHQTCDHTCELVIVILGKYAEHSSRIFCDFLRKLTPRLRLGIGKLPFEDTNIDASSSWLSLPSFIRLSRCIQSNRVQAHLSSTSTGQVGDHLSCKESTSPHHGYYDHRL